jgi:hypothetical protein
MADQPPNWDTYQPRRDDTRSVGPTPPPTSPYASGGTFATYDAPAEQRRVRRRIGVLLAGAAVVVGGAGVGVWAVVEAATDDSPSTSTTRTVTDTEVKVEVNGSGSVNLFTTAGTADLASALREERGSTQVLEVVLFHHNAVVTVADKDAPGGARIYQWDGDLTAVSESVAVRKPFDLLDLEGDVLADLCGDDPNQCTVVAGRPLPGDDGAWLTVVGSGGPQRTDLRGNPA